MRRAKILVTMGPAMENASVLGQVMLAGADAFRINFSHGDKEQHARYVALIRATAERMGRPCSLLADLMGPKVRVDAREYELRPGHEVTIVPRPGHPDRDEIGISYAGLAALVGPRQRILLDDGKLELVVENVKGKRIVCRVTRGGTLKPNKSLNVPGVDLKLPILSGKDKADLRLIKKAGFDWVAASFVRHAADIKSVKRFMGTLGLDIPVIAKVESAQAVENLREIVNEAEGVMVARGDLGVELDLEMIPTIQRNIVRLGREMGKVTIIATQMLESMTNSPRPTRAEVNDVSVGALERVDALMLSGETSVGKYPVETVRLMDKTIRNTEKNLEEEIVGISHPEPIALTCEAGMYLSLISGAKALITLSTHGSTPRILSTFRSNIPVAVACMRSDIYHRSTLYYSVLPMMIKSAADPEKVFRDIEARLKRMGLVKRGDVVVFVFGYPIHAKNRTNTVRRWEVA